MINCILPLKCSQVELNHEPSQLHSNIQVDNKKSYIAQIIEKNSNISSDTY